MAGRGVPAALLFRDAQLRLGEIERYASQSTISASAAGAACTNRILRLTVAAP
jgi:hypothetical protein